MFYIIGHRGYGPTHQLPADSHVRSIFPENSIPAFLTALDRVADGIEVDVLITSDGVPIALHGKDIWAYVLDNLEEGKNVNQYTYDEIRGLDIGGGIGIPTIETVIREVLAKRKDCVFNFDLKDAAALVPLMEVIEKADLPLRQVFLSSYKWDALREARKLSADIHLAACLKTVMLFGHSNVEMPGYRPTTAHYLPEAIEAIRELDNEVRLYAVDCTVPDITRDLIAIASDLQVGIALSTGNERVGADQIDYGRAQRIIERNDLPFCVIKADEPMRTRAAIQTALLQSLEPPHEVPEI